MTRMSALITVLAATLLAGGCASSNTVAFTNVSDTWLNVSFYASDQTPSMAETETVTTTDDPNTFVGAHTIQIQPGATEKYSLSSINNYRNFKTPLVHIKVAPVRPSWVESGPEFWLELLTDPPVTIVATGPAETLSFIGGEGAVAVIPPEQMGTFEHGVATVPTQPTEVPESK